MIIIKIKKFSLSEFFSVLFVLIIILMFFLPYIFSIVDKAKKETFERTKQLVESSAKSYILLNNDKVNFVNNKAVIQLEDLSSFLKEVKDPDGEKCSGVVNVLKTANDFKYNVDLSCGNNFKTNRNIKSPKINLNGPEIIYLWKDFDSYVEKATATDDVDGNITNKIEKIIVRSSDNKVVEHIENSKEEKYLIKYFVYDSAFNKTEKNRIVVVRRDFVSPSVAILNEYTNNLNPSVSVVVSDISKVKKYYKWTLTNEKISSDDSGWIYFENDPDITGTNSYVNNKTGSFYLHIKVVDEYFNETIVTNNNLLKFSNDFSNIVLKVDNTNVSYSHKVDIIGLKENNCKKYYKWSSESVFPKDGFLELSNDYVVLDDISGSFYLHVKIIDSKNNVKNITSKSMSFDSHSPLVDLKIDNDFYKRFHIITSNIIDLYYKDCITYFQISKNDDYNFLDDSKWELYKGNSFVVDNLTGDYYVFVKVIDSSFNVTIKKSAVVHLDNAAPFLGSSINPSNMTNEKVTISLNMDDFGNSGFYGVYLPSNNFITKKNIKYDVYENGNYIFETRDKAGNTGVYSIRISNIKE